MGLASPRLCCTPAVDPATGSREVTVFRGVVEAQFPRVICKPLHLWGLLSLIFHFQLMRNH